MKVGDIIQVRRGADWLYATVADPVLSRVQINHPGNPDDGRVFIAPIAGMRSKTDVQALIDAATPIVNAANPQHGLTHAQSRQLGALDGFWLQYLALDEKNQGARI